MSSNHILFESQLFLAQCLARCTYLLDHIVRRYLISFAIVFKEYFKFENMKMEQLKLISEMLGLKTTVSSHTYMVLQLRHHVTRCYFIVCV